MEPPDIPRSKPYPLFGDKEPIVAIRSSAFGAVVPEIGCSFTQGLAYSSDEVWGVRGCDAISAKCTYALQPPCELDDLYVELCDGSSDKFVQRRIQSLALSMEAEDPGIKSKSFGLHRLGCRGGRQAWLPIQPQTLSSRVIGIPVLSLSSYSSNLNTSGTKLAAQSSHLFENVYLRARSTSKHQAYQQYLHIVVRMYADVRTPEWIKIAQKRSNPIVMLGKVGGKTKFPSRPRRQER